MKILHLFSNWKWTGPAEHAVNLARHQQRAGHDVTFACAAAPAEATESIVRSARERGLESATPLRLNKHFSVVDNIRDVPALRRIVRGGGYDVVHTHMPNDHLLAGLALRSFWIAPPLVRTCYDGSGIEAGWRSALRYHLLTDGVITVSGQTHDDLVARGWLDPRLVFKADVPVDLARFNPEGVTSRREHYHLVPETVVGGIVARVQYHRRFPILLEALRVVLQPVPQLRFMIIGRGTHIEDIAIRPSQQMGIRPNLIFTGYQHEAYVATLATLDFKVFLMPGTDGSCRAVREAMAMGVPVIAANRGMLPEMVDHHENGLVVDDTPDNLAAAMLYMIEHPDERRLMGQAARRKALAVFSMDRFATVAQQAYERVRAEAP